MARRRRRNTTYRSPIWTWVSFLLFGFLIALFSASIYQKKSPAKVLSSWFANNKKDLDPINTMSKSELKSRVIAQDKHIDSLQEQLQQCRDADGLRKATISTSSESLNMRSGPSLTSEVILKIPVGSEVSILYYDENIYFLEGAEGSWCRIRYADQEGWVWGNYLKVKE